MKILVCISSVPDTTTKIKFNADKTEFDATGVQWIINPWDELALTRALELKETAGGIDKITVVSVGTKEIEPTIRKALAIGADNAVRIDAEAKDGYQVAKLLADYAKGENFDIILAGIESSDYNGSMVGGMLAEFLGLASVSSVSGLFIGDGQITVKREIDGGQEKLQVETPFVAIVQKGIAIDPRIPSMRGIMMARQKPLEVKDAGEAEIKTTIASFELPPPKSACKLIEEDNIGELIRVLKEEIKVL